MKKLGNILWHFPLFGFMTALFTFLIGSFFVLTVIGAPIGLGLIQHSKFLLAPFSNQMIPNSKLGKEKTILWKILSIIATIIYLPFGVIAFLLALFQTVLLCLTIIGIPIAVILAKSLSTYLNPVNKICIKSSVAEELDKREVLSKLNNSN